MDQHCKGLYALHKCVDVGLSQNLPAIVCFHNFAMIPLHVSTFQWWGRKPLTMLIKCFTRKVTSIYKAQKMRKLKDTYSLEVRKFMINTVNLTVNCI